MKISQSQLQLSRKASIGGFMTSALFHAILFTAFINFHQFEIKPSSEEKSIKINLNSFEVSAPPSPLPPAEIPAQQTAIPEPTPPAPPPPEPEIKPEPLPEPPKPVVEPKPEPKPKPKPVEKPKPKPKPKPVEKPVQKPVQETKPVEQPITQTQSVQAPTQIPASSPATSQSKAPTGQQNIEGGSVQKIGEFNFATSAGDERFSQMHKAIKKHQKYPKRASKMKHQGVVEVSFLFKTSGIVENIKVIKSSGYETLDEAAVETIKRASKEFPSLEKDYTIKIPMTYKLI